MDAFEVAGIGDLDAQQIIGAARHQKAFLDLGMFAHRRLETIEMLLRLPLERDVNDDGDRCLCLGRVHQSRIAPDHARLFHQFDAPQAGRWR